MDTDQTTTEYEISFLVKGQEGVASVRTLIQNAGITIDQEQEVREMRLAYPIQKETSAMFGFWRVHATHETIQKIHTEVKLIPEIMRIMVVKNPPSVRQPYQYTPQAAPREKRPVVSSWQAPVQTTNPEVVTNKELEKKLEEILQ